MAYFDSPKNRALWDREIKSLTAQRELRKNNPLAAVTIEQVQAFERPSRIPVTLEQLIKAENEATKKHSDTLSARAQATKTASTAAVHTEVHTAVPEAVRTTGPPVLQK